MHKYKKNEQKFIFRLVFSVFGLRGVAVYRAPAKLFFSFSPLSFSKLPRYHFDTNPLPSNTFPVLCYLSLGVHSPSIPRLYTLHATLHTLHLSLFPLKICTSANFVVPLHSIQPARRDGWVKT